MLSSQIKSRATCLNALTKLRPSMVVAICNNNKQIRFYQKEKKIPQERVKSVDISLPDGEQSAHQFEKATSADAVTISLPKKGEIVVPKKVRELGDGILSLNVLESMILSEYVKQQLGVDRDIPDPVTALLQSNQMAQLNTLPHMFAVAGMMAPAGMPAQGAAPAAAPAAAPKAEEKKEEKKEAAPAAKSAYNVKLESYDQAGKINLIKVLRQVDKNLSIKDAKDLVDGAPSTLKKDVPKDEAEKMKQTLEAAGAKIKLD